MKQTIANIIIETINETTQYTAEPTRFRHAAYSYADIVISKTSTKGPTHHFATIDLDNDIEIWTTGQPCGLYRKIEYAHPNLIDLITTALNELHTTQTRKQLPTLLTPLGS